MEHFKSAEKRLKEIRENLDIIKMFSGIASKNVFETEEKCRKKKEKDLEKY